MASSGRIEPYDGNCDLEAYLERVELYLIANNVGAISGDENEAASENQFPNRDCQRGTLWCEMVYCDAMTSGFVGDLFKSFRSSGHMFISSGVRTKQMEHA